MTTDDTLHLTKEHNSSRTVYSPMCAKCCKMFRAMAEACGVTPVLLSSDEHNEEKTVNDYLKAMITKFAQAVIHDIAERRPIVIAPHNSVTATLYEQRKSALSNGLTLAQEAIRSRVAEFQATGDVDLAVSGWEKRFGMDWPL